MGRDGFAAFSGGLFRDAWAQLGDGFDRALVDMSEFNKSLPNYKALFLGWPNSALDNLANCGRRHFDFMGMREIDQLALTQPILGQRGSQIHCGFSSGMGLCCL